MKKSRSIIFVLLLSLTVVQLSCIEEDVISSLTKDFETQALILREIEKRGDYLNSSDFPALRSAFEVFNSLESSIILDVRTVDEFNNGHIKDAINISNIGLFDYVVNSYDASKDYIIISNTGQSASYYTSLFRLYGFKNFYALQYGMASWHSDFSSLLTNKIGSPSIQGIFNNIFNPKPSFTALPVLEKPDNRTVEDFFVDRIKKLFTDGFDESSYRNINTINTVDFEYLVSLINSGDGNDFFICFANVDLYFYKQIGVYENPGHPNGAVLYSILFPTTELKSTSYLQTLPANKTILLYSFFGDYSAMGVAHLRLLGYDAKSVLFGAHAMFYDRLPIGDSFQPYVYKKELVQDYPYGN